LAAPALAEGKPNEPIGKPQPTQNQPDNETTEETHLVGGVLPADPSANEHNESRPENSSGQNDETFPLLADFLPVDIQQDGEITDISAQVLPWAQKAT